MKTHIYMQIHAYAIDFATDTFFSLTLMTYNHEIAVKSHKNYGDVKFSCFNCYESLIYLLVDLSKPDLARKSQKKSDTSNAFPGQL